MNGEGSGSSVFNNRPKIHQYKLTIGIYKWNIEYTYLFQFDCVIASMLIQITLKSIPKTVNSEQWG